jgi:hypothetical protein
MPSRGLILTLLVCLGVVGCETTADRVGRDPLLLSRRGVEGNPANAAPSALLVSVEPLPPDLPSYALVTARQPAARLREQAGALARQKLETDEKQLPNAAETEVANQPGAALPQAAPGPTALPATTRLEQPPVPAMPVKRQVVHGTYGAAANHSWLQGTVERVGPEGATLRYGHPWVAGAQAFRVLLSPDERLKDLRIGDVIRVEGEELENPSDRALPLYQLKSLTKVSLDS